MPYYSVFEVAPAIEEGNGNPPQCSCLENPRDGGAWWAAVYGAAELDTTEATWQQQQPAIELAISPNIYTSYSFIYLFIQKVILAIYCVPNK